MLIIWNCVDVVFPLGVLPKYFVCQPKKQFPRMQLILQGLDGFKHHYIGYLFLSLENKSVAPLNGRTSKLKNDFLDRFGHV